jgi:hypothetical protein
VFVHKRGADYAVIPVQVNDVEVHMAANSPEVDGGAGAVVSFGTTANTT